MGMLLRRLKRLSIASQAGLLMGLMLLGTCGVLFVWAKENAVSAEVRHAKTVADMADSFRAIASKHGGFYVRRNASDDVALIGKYLAEFKSVASPDGAEFVFHQKNPFLAIADFSNEVQSSRAEAKFRITSDNMMNPSNSPDLFDLESLRLMRETGVEDNWRIVGNQLRYARALIADQSCLKCHSTPNEAPESVRLQYRGPSDGSKGGGYGYTVGEVVGVTSVSVPHATAAGMLVSQSQWFWILALAVLGLMALAYWLAVVGVVNPMKKLTVLTNEIARARSAEELGVMELTSFDSSERSSSNEIHGASFALKSLHQSMWAAMKFVKAGKSQ